MVSGARTSVMSAFVRVIPSAARDRLAHESEARCAGMRVHTYSGPIPRYARDDAQGQMFIYVLASKTRRLYVGVTNDLVRRVWEHRFGVQRGFTHRYSITRLVHYESMEDPIAAIRREKQIKSWGRVQRLALVESTNPGWGDLAERWFESDRRADPSLRSG
jgi:putative endonuclease